jgi:plastocyanin
MDASSGRVDCEDFMSLFRFVGIASLALLVSACGSNDSSTPPTAPTPTPPPASGTTVTIGTGASTAGAAAFGMNPLTVATGTTVVFRNSDVVPHTATADAGGGFNTGTINANGQASVTFSASGTVKYHCTIHPGMIGTIVVQ